MWKLGLGEVKRPDSDYRSIRAGRIRSWGRGGGAGSWVGWRLTEATPAREEWERRLTHLHIRAALPSPFLPLRHFWPIVKEIEGSESLDVLFTPHHHLGSGLALAHTTYPVLHLGPSSL